MDGFKSGIGLNLAGGGTVMGIGTSIYLCLAPVVSRLTQTEFRQLTVGLIIGVGGVVLGVIYIIGLHWRADSQIKALNPKRLDRLEAENNKLVNRCAALEAEIKNRDALSQKEKKDV